MGEAAMLLLGLPKEAPGTPKSPLVGF